MAGHCAKVRTVFFYVIALEEELQRRWGFLKNYAGASAGG
jgi:hypothetical protein